MPMGRVKKKANPQAKRMPHQGNWSCDLKTSVTNIARAIMEINSK